MKKYKLIKAIIKKLKRQLIIYLISYIFKGFSEEFITEAREIKLTATL